jgi:hypothetical protein
VGRRQMHPAYILGQAQRAQATNRPRSALGAKVECTPMPVDDDILQPILGCVEEGRYLSSRHCY